MVADSITDSELFHGSPISRDSLKKRKANWLWKLKQWKIDARRKQWIHLWKKGNVGEERLTSLPDNRKTVSERFSWSIEDDNETGAERASSASSSPTSVLKSKDSHSSKSGEDCFCCSEKIAEEEDDCFDDAFDNFDSLRDVLNSSHNKGTPPVQFVQQVPKPRENKSTARHLSQRDKFEQGSSSTGKAVQGQINKRSRKRSDQQQPICPICTEEMDETDLSFRPCKCGFLVCLFCHKKINENDGKCPNCRNKYDATSTSSGVVGFQQPGRGTLGLSTSFKGLKEA